MPNKDKKKPKTLTAEEQYWEKVEENSHYLIADTLNKCLPLPNLRDKNNFDPDKDVDYRTVLQGIEDYYYSEDNEEELPNNPETVAESVAYEYLLVIIHGLVRDLSTWTPYTPDHFASLVNY